jgi:hypothetical protein
MKVVVTSTLRCRASSDSNRGRARALAWDWVASKWPQLMPPARELDKAQVQRALPGQELMAGFDDTRANWSLSLAHQQRASARVWMVRAQVTHSQAFDVLKVQIACTDLPESQPVVAPPRLLSDWVDALDLDDAGIAIEGYAREVVNPHQLGALHQHLISSERTLPVIALVNKPNSRFYGVDPQGLARAVRGLAHVACVDAQLAPALAALVGRPLALAYSAARVFAPGLANNTSPAVHPLFRAADAPHPADGTDPGNFIKKLTQKICAMSVQATPPALAAAPQ